MKTYILLFVYATPKIYIRDYLSLEPSETDFLGKVPIYPSFVSGFSYRTKLFFFFFIIHIKKSYLFNCFFFCCLYQTQWKICKMFTLRHHHRL